MDKQKLFADVVAYIHLNGNFEHWEIEEGWECIRNRMPIPNHLAGKIYDVLDDFAEDYELPDDWWFADWDVEDFFFEIDIDND